MKSEDTGKDQEKTNDQEASGGQKLNTTLKARVIIHDGSLPGNHQHNQYFHHDTHTANIR